MEMGASWDPSERQVEPAVDHGREAEWAQIPRGVAGPKRPADRLVVGILLDAVVAE